MDILMNSSRFVTMFIPIIDGVTCFKTEHMVNTIPPPSVTDVGPLPIDLCMPPGGVSTNLNLDENAVIHAGPVSVNLTASGCTPIGTPKAVLNWNAIEPKPDAAPDPASAR
jgi:hypothetical protein